MEGIRRAQRAAEAGMAAVASLIARAGPGKDGAVAGGAPLTSERLRHVLLATFLEHGAVASTAIPRTARRPRPAMTAAAG